MKNRPKPTMQRNDQNSTGTLGTVDQAAAVDLRGRRHRRVVRVAQQQQAIAQVLRRWPRSAPALPGPVIAAGRRAAAAGPHRRACPSRCARARVPTSSLMPSTGSSTERVAIRPSSHGTCTRACVVRCATSGKPNTVKAAGGWRGVPLRLDRGDLHALVLPGEVAGLIARAPPPRSSRQVRNLPLPPSSAARSRHCGRAAGTRR